MDKTGVKALAQECDALVAKLEPNVGCKSSSGKNFDLAKAEADCQKLHDIAKTLP